jgi:hypothetical protein
MYVCTAALLLSLILFPKPSIFSKTLSHQKHGASLVLRCSKTKVEEEMCLKSIGGLLMSFAASRIPSQNVNIVSGSFSFLVYAILKSLLSSKRTPIIASWNLVRPLLSNLMRNAECAALQTMPKPLDVFCCLNSPGSALKFAPITPLFSLHHSRKPYVF